MAERFQKRGYMRSGDEKGWKNLDRGNFSTVYHVVSCSAGAPRGRHFAVKELRDYDAKEGPKLFDEEVRIFRHVGSHPHIVELADSFIDSATGHGCLVLDYCDSGSLQRRIEAVIAERTKSESSPATAFAEDQLLTWLKQLCSALAHLAAKGIIHNDINLRNILLHGGVAKLADLGVARTVGLAGHRGSRKQRSIHSSPELLRMEKTTFASDVYGLGCVMLDLMLVQDPEKRSLAWAEETEHALAAAFAQCDVNYSSSLVSITKTMLQREPRLRPSAAQLFERLNALLAPGSSA